MASPVVLDPQQLALAGVPRVSFYDGGQNGRCPEDFPFQSCVRAWLEHSDQLLGCKHVRADDIRTGCTYALLITASGYSGSAAWHPGEWDHGCCALDARWDDVRLPIDRTLAAIGRRGTLVGNADRDGRPRSIEGLTDTADETAMRQIIVETLQSGHPVLAFGVVGPPECCLICGYDEGGDVLIGWSYFQEWQQGDLDVELDETGMFRRRNWYPQTSALLTISPKAHAGWTIPYREMMRYNLEALRGGRVGPYVTGIDVWDAWAQDLGSEERFQSDDLDVLTALHSPHSDAVGNVAEARWYGHMTVLEAAAHLPEAKEPLKAAAAYYKEQHDLMWKVWNAAGGNGVGEAQARALAEPAAREAVVALLAQAKALDTQALEQFELALAALR